MRPSLYLLAFCIMAVHGPSTAQDTLSSSRNSVADHPPGPVDWKFTGGKVSANQCTLEFRAAIPPGWKLYSTTMPDSLPNTRIVLDSPGAAKIISPIVEKGERENKKDPLFGNAVTRFFEHETDWLIKVELPGQEKDAGHPDLKGVVTYMAIYNDSVIGPLDVPFRFSLTQDGALVARSTSLKESMAAADQLRKGSIDLAHPVNACGGTGTEDSKSKSLMGIFILGFLGGLLGLIMPCTFPMIPLTVSFFTKRSASRSKGIFNACLYGFFIFLIYVLLSLPFYFLKASNVGILNNISTNVWLNLFFALIFLVFALSFFGLFEIALPGGISNSVDAKSGIGSIGGIFFLALTLAIVSFSCTGPILGSLLVGAFDQTGGAIQLTFAMAGFGLALGLPFALFALFPSWLQSLPEIRGLDEYGKGGIRIYRAGADAQISFECRSGHALGSAEKGDLFCDLDRHRHIAGDLFAKTRQGI